MNFRSLALAGIFIFATGCGREPREPLRVGTNVWPGYECLYLARNLGYFKDADIRLIDYPSLTDERRAWRNGAIEVAATTLDEALLLADHPTRPHIVLVMDFSSGGDVILAKPAIHLFGEIKGKRVGVESTSLGAFVLTRALEINGMSVNDITLVSIDFPDHEDFYLKNKVDVVVTYEPVKTKLLASGARNIFDSKQIPKEIMDVLIVREDVLDIRRAELEVLITGWYRALDYLRQHPRDAAMRIAPHEGITPEQFLESLKGLYIPDLMETRELLGNSQKSIRAGIRNLSRVMIERGLLKSGERTASAAPIPVDDRFIAEYAPR